MRREYADGNGGHVPTLYIAGDAPGVGVTAVAAGLASLHGGATLGKAASFRSPDPDADFHRTLQPGVSLPEGWPVTLTPGSPVAVPANPSAAGHLSIVEGVSGAPSAQARLRADAAIAEALDARVLLVTTTATADPESATSAFGDRLLGVVVNRVFAHDEQSGAARAFEEADIPVLGQAPEDRRMLAPTVRQVREHLGAECINMEELEAPDDALDALVEHFMLGGLFLDAGVYVFGRREQKAVIVRGDRPDLQMAALETSTVCLVLTGGQLPVQYIVHHAALNQTPMLMVSRPTLETMEALHDVGERANAGSVYKARRFGELLSAHCDLSPLAGAVA